METAARLIIMVLFIVLVAIGIVIFSVFGILPAQKLSQKINQPKATSTVESFQAPETSTPFTSPGQTQSYRPSTAGTDYFEIRADGGRYSPASISAKEGDVLTISFTAVDKAYNITFPDFGISKTTVKGATDFIQFQVTSVGTYKFFCKDACETPVEGSIKVSQKNP